MIQINRHFGVVIGLAVVVFLCLFSSVDVSAYSATLTTSTDVTVNVVPTSNDGVSIHGESLNVESNCRNGYNLSIATPNGSDLYLYENGTQAGAPTITAVDGTSALNSSSNTNKWGYYFPSSNTTPTGDTVFSPLSSTAATLKTTASTASQTNINDTFSIYYGTKVDLTTTPGSYRMASNGTIRYYLTMDATCTTYSVQYQDNGADNPNGMGTTDSATGDKSVRQINIAADTKITLLAPNFKKAGYSFLGWSTDQNAYTHFTDNDNTNDPIIYGPNEDVVIDASVMATATLRNQINMYAIWIPALKDGSNNLVYLQEWDNPNTTLPHDGCSTLTQTVFDDTVADEKGKITATKDSIVALTDKRDNEVYTVARLADGNCWMTENLRLEAAGTRGNSINDSNVTNQYLSQGYGGTTGTYGNFVGLATSESTNFKDSTAVNDIYKSDDSGSVFDSNAGTLEDIGTYNPGYRFPRYNNSNNASALSSPTYTENYANASSPSTTGSYKTSRVSSYGNYYTWAATIANTNYYSGSSAELAGTSICPSGWHLPSSGGVTKEYGILSQGYGGNGDNQNSANSGGIMSGRIRSFPNNFLFSGRLAASTTENRGRDGGYWSRSAYTYTDPYVLFFQSTNLYPSTHYNKGNGYGVRCLAGGNDVEITLDSNNGTGAISRVYGVAGSLIELPISYNPSASIAQSGYGFKNWNTSSNGSGTSYTSSYSIPASSTGVTLYAQWYPQYTITYVNNCMSWASGDVNCSATASAGNSKQKINLDASGNGSGTLGAYNKFYLTGWKIKEWTTNADGTGAAYPVSRTYSVTGANAGDGITLYAHWVPLYSIQYDGNGASNIDGMGTTDASTGVKSVKQTNVGMGDSVTLLASNFKRANYGFVGWSTDSDAWTHFMDNDATNDPIIYGPTETISAPAKPNSSILTLYAVWVPAETSGGNPVYLQEWNDCHLLTSTSFNSTTGVITVTKNSIVALTDKRDDEVYAIAKLSDGNCWMIENLRLEREGTVGNNKNDSSVTNESLSQGYGSITGTYGKFVGLATSESSFPSSATTANTIYKSDGSGDVYDPANNTLEDIGTSNYPATRFPRYNNSNTASALTGPTYTENYVNASNPSTSGTYKASTVASYGNYYTWAAAIADTAYYSSGDHGTTSLCPKGWRLPIGGQTVTDKSFGNLSVSLGGPAGGAAADSSSTPTGAKMAKVFRSYPNNFLYSGYFSGSGAGNRGSTGEYWSSTANTYSGGPISTNGSYSMFLSNTSLSQSNSNKDAGRSIRCVAESPQSVSTQANNIGYYANATGAEGTMGLQSITSSSTSATLLASNFSKDGYGFAGWSDVPDYYTNSNAHFYGPQETITFTAGQYSTDGLSLYAVWVKSEGSLQDSSKVTSVCNRLTTAPTNGTANLSSVSALTDQRDNQTYAIAKLADGKCWMIENLRLDNTASHNSDGTLSRGYNSSFIGLAGPESPWANNSTTANSLYSTDGSTSATISGSNQDYRFPRYNNVNSPANASSRPQSPTANNATNTTSNAGIYSYSNYYTWTAAVADTTDYTTGNQSISNTSICPSGWHLPKGDNKSNEANNEFWALVVTGINGGVTPANYSSSTNPNYTGSSEGTNASNALRAYPNNFIYSGHISTGSVTNRGVSGRYWSSTVSSSTSAYNMYITSTNVNPGTSSNYKYFGWSIRCVAGN